MDNTERQERYNKYVQMQFGELVGKTVSGVRALTDSEVADLLWYDGEVGVVIEFTDGTYLILSKDEEGNGAGFGFLGMYDETVPETARQIVFG